ncbi:MAG: glycosyltransferase family 4 protein [Nitrosomonadales bacterium]
MLNFANELIAKNYSVEILTMDWKGPKPANIKIHQLDSFSLFNHIKYLNFKNKVIDFLKDKNNYYSVSFSKISGFDYYYAADSCFAKRIKYSWQRFLPRYRNFLNEESEIFKKNSKTKILYISEVEKKIYEKYYGKHNRYFFIPPYIRENFFSKGKIKLNLNNLLPNQNNKFIVFIGSGFKTKGLDRAILAFHSLPDKIKSQYDFLIIGHDNSNRFQKLINQLGLQGAIKIIPGLNDIPSILNRSSLLIHPARMENTGLVLLEAMAANLPILTTDICGYSNFVKKDKNSIVLKSPFVQQELNEKLQKMLQTKKKIKLKLNLKKFSKYQMGEIFIKSLG